LKKFLRNKLIIKRKKSYLDINYKHTSKIFNKIISRYKNIKIVGGYIPINYEYNCLELLKLFESKKYNISLPLTKNNYQMDFYKYSFKDPLKINKLGIPEPINSSNKVIPDLILVPLVGFDKNLNRLGYGGGFYDRYFDKISKLKKIVKIGLAFSFQEIKKLPTNKFDKKLDRIITEKKI
tara:strand:+ start:779 stop:1318 length:540 start_codon:yes stop_codon:yes gene_type:complete